MKGKERTMDLKLEGRVALVTGTASQIGMGNAISKYLAKEGCDIISVDINLEGAQQTADAVKALGKKAIALKADVANGAEVDEMVEAALKEFGRIDILVNTAGLSAGGPIPFTEQTTKTWQKDIDVNLYGTMNCSKAVIPSMIKQKYGKIVNFASIAARQPLLGSYSAAKAGVISITHGLAAQYGPEGINANAIAPGVVQTNFFGKIDERLRCIQKYYGPVSSGRQWFGYDVSRLLVFQRIQRKDNWVKNELNKRLLALS
jgi:NAD(P)-dependent dehydrogenase (short-subunit alcohol dehydrogenase family)